MVEDVKLDVDVVDVDVIVVVETVTVVVLVVVDLVVEVRVVVGGHGSRQSPVKPERTAAWKSSKLDSAVKPGYHPGFFTMPSTIANCTAP